MTPKPKWDATTLFRVFQATQQLFATELGHEVLGYLEEEFFDRTSFSTNAREMAFQEGERSVLLTIRYRLNTDLAQLAQELHPPKGEVDE